MRKANRIINKERRRRRRRNFSFDELIHSIKYEMTFSSSCHQSRRRRKLTPSAPLLSLVDVEGALSLPLFVLEYWLGVDILLIQST